MYIVYTFLYKNKKIFFYFFKPNTIGTIKKSVVYNGYMLKFVPNTLGTMRYNWYNC